jgi:hypothetical protein
MTGRRTAIPYRYAILWIVVNDDTEWLDADGESEARHPSVTACLVADIYGRTTEEVTADLLRARRVRR